VGAGLGGGRPPCVDLAAADAARRVSHRVHRTKTGVGRRILETILFPDDAVLLVD